MIVERLIVTFIAISINSGVNCELLKIWNSDFNHHQRNKWLWNDDNCPYDRIIYPDESIIFIDKIVPSQEIILPKNGEIIFGDHVEMIRSQSTNCIGSDRKFYIVSGDWLDPRNWNSSIEGYLIDGKWENNPIPHSDRIPCNSDRVIFPKGSTWKVNLKLLSDSFIGSIEINGIPLNNQEFQSFLRTSTGRLLFSSNFAQTLTIGQNELDCDNGNGCSCDHRSVNFIQAICSTIQCPAVKCNEPFQPEGHCCPICGSLIRVNLDDNSDWPRFYQHFNDLWSHQAQGVLGYASKNTQGQIEAILTDSDPFQGQSRVVAQKFYSDLLDSRRKLGFNVRSPELIISINSDNSSFGFAGLFVTIIVLLIILFVVGLVYQRRSTISLDWLRPRSGGFPGSQFTFIRFQGLGESSERIGMELGSTSTLTSEVAEQSSDLPSTSLKPISKSASVLFSISEEKISFDKMPTKVTTASIANLDEVKDQQTELETSFEPKSTHDKALLLDVVSLE